MALIQDWSVKWILHAATLRWELHIMLVTSPRHSRLISNIQSTSPNTDPIMPDHGRATTTMPILQVIYTIWSGPQTLHLPHPQQMLYPKVIEVVITGHTSFISDYRSMNLSVHLHSCQSLRTFKRNCFYSTLLEMSVQQSQVTYFSLCWVCSPKEQKTVPVSQCLLMIKKTMNDWTSLYPFSNAVFFQIFSILICSKAEGVFYSVLFYSRLCPSTAGSSPPPVLQLSLSFAILVYTAPCCPTMSSLQWRFSLPTDLTPCASNSPSTIFHSGDVSSPFPFHTGYVSDYVCHFGWQRERVILTN